MRRAAGGTPLLVARSAAAVHDLHRRAGGGRRREGRGRGGVERHFLRLRPVHRGGDAPPPPGPRRQGPVGARGDPARDAPAGVPVASRRGPPPSRSRSSTSPRRRRACRSTACSAAPATVSPPTRARRCSRACPPTSTSSPSASRGAFAPSSSTPGAIRRATSRLRGRCAASTPAPASTSCSTSRNNYTREEAMQAGRELADLGFRWFEAPLPDHDLEGYRALTPRAFRSRSPFGELDPGPLALWRGAPHPNLGRRAHRRHHDGRHRPGPGGRGPRPFRGTRLRDHVLGLQPSPRPPTSTSCSRSTIAPSSSRRCPTRAFEYGMVDVIRPGPDGFVTAPGASPASACGWTGRRWRRPPSTWWRLRNPEPPAAVCRVSGGSRRDQRRAAEAARGHRVRRRSALPRGYRDPPGAAMACSRCRTSSWMECDSVKHVPGRAYPAGGGEHTLS